MTSFLHSLGASPELMAAAADFAVKLGRVCFQSHDLFRLFGSEGQEVLCVLTGRFHRNADELGFPCVGDWVLYRPTSEGRGVIEEVLNRKSLLVRVSAGESGRPQSLAANVDWAFVVTSMDADFSPRRLERYLSLIQVGGARPALLLSKADLASSPEEYLAAARALLPEGPVLALSTRSGQGMADFEALLMPSETGVFLGSSGVGKSTLINYLLRSEVQVTQQARSEDAKGRHTTTARHLLLASGDRVLIDTPGMRELQLDPEAVDITVVFPEIIELMEHCRFSDCRHHSEPGCGVKEALTAGTLSSARWDSYQKLLQEQQQQRAQQQRAQENRAKYKRIRRGV